MSLGQSRCRSRRLRLLFTSLTLGLALSWASSWADRVAAQVPSTASEPPPPELANLLSRIDTAASAGDLAAVMRFYSPNFTSADGLTYNTLKQTLEDLWKRYPDLQYQTTLESWERQGDAITTVTTTTITGVYPDERRDLNLSATITARQRLQNDQIVEQEILSERSELTAGDNPPTVSFNLPEQVTPGQEFDFDAVVMEPLGERLLLGAALEEPIGVENYLNPAPVELELLSSGGLFKVGQAPKSPDDRWISAVIVRYDGITAVTQRLRVVDQAGN
ncbi:nuclear transport factor 2 family protein [Leptolyngbya sp. NK1-12]|uniref:Nuclear transport factor 2 family protein n=2 Tax=Leptolyngbya sp. NK1-12 TaxID=2547451 RepID=A0AA96WPX5_9CYAN|nr:nuclear transport factor 2 family protein [Leptolyngbya sp. NK1-12]